MAQRPGMSLPTMCVAMIAKRLSTVEPVEISWTACNPGWATCNSQKR